MKKKLEVGKTYLTRNGGTVTIVKTDGTDVMPFKGGNGFWYTEDGRALTCGDGGCEESVDWTAPAAAPATPAPAFSPTQVSRLLDALNLARNGRSDTVWRGALVALEEALCPEDGKESQ